MRACHDICASLCSGSLQEHTLHDRNNVCANLCPESLREHTPRACHNICAYLCPDYLQEHLAPILLRRMKEDVETLPEKEEVVVWVQLTPEQHQYYM